MTKMYQLEMYHKYYEMFLSPFLWAKILKESLVKAEPQMLKNRQIWTKWYVPEMYHQLYKMNPALFILIENTIWGRGRVV